MRRIIAKWLEYVAYRVRGEGHEIRIEIAAYRGCVVLIYNGQTSLVTPEDAIKLSGKLLEQATRANWSTAAQRMENHHHEPRKD